MDKYKETPKNLQNKKTQAKLYFIFHKVKTNKQSK